MCNFQIDEISLCIDGFTAWHLATQSDTIWRPGHLSRHTSGLINKLKKIKCHHWELKKICPGSSDIVPGHKIHYPGSLVTSLLTHKWLYTDKQVKK